MLRARTRIEAHYEVVAIVVRGLQFLGRLGEQEGAPVGVAAHDAVLREDYGAGGFGDSVVSLLKYVLGLRACEIGG